VRQLLEEEVLFLAVGLHSTFDVKANSIVARGCGENHETLTGFHRFTSVRVAPHGLRAWTTG
jgi:hypothetical protein